MLIYRRTSIMDSSAQTLVNTVNCVGVMGKGIAKEFKTRYPSMFKAYSRVCEERQLAPGKLWLWRGPTQWVLNFPTKIDWRNPSRLEWIEAGLQKFVSDYQDHGVREISFPRLGCGNGGLLWEDVKPLMERFLSDIEIPVYIHDLNVDIGLPEHMEQAAKQLATEALIPYDYDSFLQSIQRLLEITSGELETLDTSESFRASLSAEDGLRLYLGNSSWTIEHDALRGVWFSLLKGLVTRDKASWFAPDTASPMLAVLSSLPDVRPVQIERKKSSGPELAVQLIPNSKRLSMLPKTRQHTSQ